MELLFKLFIKDKDNTADEKVRAKYGEFAGTVGIIVNLILCIIKFFAGFLSGSVGIMADAFNNLSDAGSSVVSLTGIKLSGKPADNDHPFGHGRMEYISALIVSFVIILMGFELAKSSLSKIVTPDEIIFSPVSVIILIVAIFCKVWLYLLNKKIGEKISSSPIIATAKDSLSDSLSTFAVLVSLLIAKLFDVNIDGWAGLLVSLFILYTGIETVKDSLSPLLGNPPDSELVAEIEKTVLAHSTVIGIHDLIIHNYGPARFMMSLHAEVPSGGNILEMHDEIDLIEKELCEKFKCVAVIHMDPIETDNALVSGMRNTVTEIVENISKDLSMHDFRMVTGPTHTNLIFDIVVPFDFEMSDGEIKEEIRTKVSGYNNAYLCVIEIDKKMV